MVYRQLGRTGMYTSLLSFGSHTDLAYRVGTPFGSVLNEEGQKRRDRHLVHGLDIGINTLDVYEHEGQWEPVARLMQGRRDKLILSLSPGAREYIGITVDRAAKLFGHVDLMRLYVNDFQRFDGELLHDWDALRKSKEAGKVRAIGLSSHNEHSLLAALRELDGLDYVLFPYNFIHARADFMEFIPAARAKGVALIAMKPLAMGSITGLDPRASSGPKPESDKVVMYGSRKMVMLPGAVAELTRTLGRLPDETLCQAAMRFVFSRPFLSSVFNGMWDHRWIDDNHAALQRYSLFGKAEKAALDAVAEVARLLGPSWLPEEYRWLEQRWRA
jgi:aryl-alcohol dehydrogenase-like predicted oxidoreductase